MEFLVERQQRVDLFVSEKTGISRRKAGSAVKWGLVMVNGRAVKKGELLNPGDRVVIDERIMEYDELLPDFEMSLPVILETEEFLALEKPSGIPVNPVKPFERGTVANFLKARYPWTLEFGYSPKSPGMLNRLDTMASGIILVAKNKKMFSYLRKLFEERRILKEFAVLVQGEMREEGRVEVPLVHHPSNKKKMLPLTSERLRYRGKPYPAITLYRPEKVGDGVTHLTVILKTGVTHQIRVHMAYLGHPVIGDTLYGGPPADRIYIHLKRLSFEDPNGKRVEIFSPVPWEDEKQSN